MLNVDHIVTGHNADDIAETVLMNSKYLQVAMTPTVLDNGLQPACLTKQPSFTLC